MNDASKQLREMVRQLERKFGILQENELSCCGISIPHCHALVEIGRAKEISLNNLAQLLNLDNSTMSRTVNKLVSLDYVKRNVDPQDRRYVTISLTKSGRGLFDTIENGMDAYFEKIYASIPHEKREQVLESVKLLVDAFMCEDCC